jgi:hypothetical protein
MAGGVWAALKALGEDAAQAGRQIGETVARFFEKTAANADESAGRSLEADAKSAARIAAVRKDATGAPEAGGGGAAAGPPWPVADGTPGSAAGKSLGLPHSRHTISGAKSGWVKGDNTIALRGNEGVFGDDVRQIAAGTARWDAGTQRYVINGRSYGVEANGTVFPDPGPGLVKLNRVEFKALQQIVNANGDLGKIPAFSHDPAFLNNPQAIAKAKAIYNGTYVP